MLKIRNMLVTMYRYSRLDNLGDYMYGRLMESRENFSKISLRIFLLSSILTELRGSIGVDSPLRTCKTREIPISGKMVKS